MDPTSFLAKLYALRDEIVFFWQNPGALKVELGSNHQLLVEIIVAILVFLLLLYILFKPAKKPKVVKTGVAPQAIPAKEAPNTQKTFSKALEQQHRKEPPLVRPVRPTPKKVESAPLHDLTEEEEHALKEAMSLAGKQALAEVTGEPHQTEIFQSAQAQDAAKKLFAGQKRDQEALDAEAAAKISPLEFIMLYFMAPRSQAFESSSLFDVLQREDLELNEQHVFEYVDESGLQFYVASAIKPGYFDIQREHYSIPGISFVLDLATCQNSESAFSKMLSCIHDISQSLRGDILDDKRERLTQASIHQFMARIKNS